MKFGMRGECGLQWRTRRHAVFSGVLGAGVVLLLGAASVQARVPTEAEKLQWAQRRVEMMREARNATERMSRERSEFRSAPCSPAVLDRVGVSWLALVHRTRPNVGAPAVFGNSTEAPSAEMRREDLAVFNYVVESAVAREDGRCELRVLASPSVDPRLGIDSRRMDSRLVGVRFRQDADSGRALGRSILIREGGSVREVELPEVALPSRLSQFELFPLSPQLEFSGAWASPERRSRTADCARVLRLDEAFESWIASRSSRDALDSRLRGSLVEGDDFWGRPVTMCLDSGKPWPVRWRTAFGSGVVLGFSEPSQSRNDHAGE